MLNRRMTHLQQRLAEAGIDVALITDDDNVCYLTGYSTAKITKLEIDRHSRAGRRSRTSSAQNAAPIGRSASLKS